MSMAYCGICITGDFIQALRSTFMSFPRSSSYQFILV